MVMWEFVAFCLRSSTHLGKVFVLEESIWAGASWVQQITWWGGKLGAGTKGGMGERMRVEVNTCHSIDTGVCVSLEWNLSSVLFVCVQPCWMRMRRTGWTRSRCASSPRWASQRAELSKPSGWTSECSSTCLAPTACALTQICIFFVPLYGSPKWRLEKVLTPRSAASGGVQVAQGRGIGAGCALQGLWVTGLPGWHCFQVSNSHFLQLSKSDFTEEKANLAHPHWPFSCRNILCADL